MTLSNMYKALAPALLGVIAVVTEWIASGVLDADALRIAAATVVTTFFVWLIPNEPSPPTV